MTFTSAKELLNSLLEGHRLAPSELDDVVAGLGEGQHLDYKSGEITHSQNRAKGRSVIREYVSGFANADGGVLIIGVSDGHAIAPCEKVGQATLDEWASDLLIDMGPFLVPPVRLQVVNHSKGPVLVIAVARSPQLVTCVESRRAKYYLRVHQSTVEVPEFLASDLFLGRRQQPIVDLSVRPAVYPDLLQGARIVSFHFNLKNVGLLTAEEVEVGFVCWTLGQTQTDLNPQLLSHLDVVEPEDSRWTLKHEIIQQRMGEELRMPPFTANAKPLSIGGYRFPAEYPWRFSAAVYILARQAAPAWFESEFIYWPRKDAPPGYEMFQSCISRRVVGRRPEVRVVRADRGAGG